MKLRILFFFLVIFLVSCTSSTPTSTETPIPTATSTLTPVPSLTPTLIPTNTPAPKPAEHTISDDGLGSGWGNWSWSSDIHTLSTEVAYTGKYSISVSTSPWGALSLGKGPPISTAKYYWLEFYIFVGDNTEQAFRVYCVNSRDEETSRGVYISPSPFIEGGKFKENQWQKVQIPLNTLGAENIELKNIRFQEGWGTSNQYYIDGIRLIAKGTETTEQEILPMATIDADPTIYDNFDAAYDDRAFNWDLWQWNTSPYLSDVTQEDGNLTIKHSASDIQQGTNIYATQLQNFSLADISSFETKLMVTSESEGGIFSIHLTSDKWQADNYLIQCLLVGKQDAQSRTMFCFSSEMPFSKPAYITKRIPINFNQWYTLKITVDSEANTISFFADDEFLGSYSSDLQTDAIHNSKFNLVLGAWSTAEDITGKIDYIRVVKSE